MYLIISLAIASIYGLINPFWDRVHNSSVWIAKALSLPESDSKSYLLSLPEAKQRALMDGWPSTLNLIVSCLPFISAGVGLFNHWWVGLVGFFTSVLISSISKNTSISSNTIDHYIAFFIHRMDNRFADYKTKGDSARAEAALSFSEDLTDLLIMYKDSGVIVPTMKQAVAAPTGEPKYLLINKYAA